ncbi:MAG: MmgE/PrpD family protein [Thermodesulfobacteriota bacterium]
MNDFSRTEALSNFVVQSRIEDFPKEVIEAGKKCFLDWIGVTLGAAQDPSVRILIELVTEIGGQKQASILGHGIKTNLLNAALVNGTMSHVLDYDDAHSGTRSHPSAPLIPALLSISEYKGGSGDELITAFITGFEVSTRIGLTLGKAYYDSGWHATSILGRFGAAAGVGKLLKLDAKQLANAFALAATQAGGLRRVFGTMGKPFHAGKAAMDGMLSALLSQRGFTAPGDILDGKPSFLEMFSAEGDANRMIEGLGKDYQVLNDSFKPYASCLLVHAAMDGLIWMRNQYQLHPDLIEEINLEVAPLCLMVTDNRNPKDGLEGKFSVYFCAALGMMRGEGRNSLFTDEVVHDPSIRDLMRKINAIGNASLKETEANIKVKLKNGTQLTRQVIAPKGDPRNPLSFDEIEEKFRDLSLSVLSKRRQDQVIKVIRELESLKDVARLLRLCRFESEQRQDGWKGGQRETRR